MKMIPAPEKMGVVIWKSVGETWISSGKNGQKCEICTIKARSGPPFLVLFRGTETESLRTLDISIRKFRGGVLLGGVPKNGGSNFGGGVQKGGVVPAARSRSQPISICTRVQIHMCDLTVKSIIILHACSILGRIMFTPSGTPFAT